MTCTKHYDFGKIFPPPKKNKQIDLLGKFLHTDIQTSGLLIDDENMIIIHHTNGHHTHWYLHKGTNDRLAPHIVQYHQLHGVCTTIWLALYYKYNTEIYDCKLNMTYIFTGQAPLQIIRKIDVCMPLITHTVIGPESLHMPLYA